MTEKEYNEKFEELQQLGRMCLGDMTEEQHQRSVDLSSELLTELYRRCKEEHPEIEYEVCE